jgi:ABC-type Zn uptake system ZnuABC Zn-binding protein ZnuA
VKRFVLSFVVLAALAATTPAGAVIRVVASTTDLASIAATVGGDQVEVSAIAKPTADVHRVEVLPSYMVRVARAAVYLKVGLGLDQWADGIIDGSRNSHLVIADCSQGVDVLEKPTGKVDASMGDVHPNGNPHYWLDPRNGGIVAGTIAETFARVDPAHATFFRQRAQAFAEEASNAWKQGQETLAKLPARDVITYHASWNYFAHAFDLDIAGTVEPVPGIPPTAKHLASLVQILKARKVPVLIQEPYFSADAGRFLNRQSGIRVVTLSPSCDTSVAGSYLDHIAAAVRAIAAGAS